MKKLKKKICIFTLIICLLLIVSMFCSYFAMWMSIPVYRIGSCLKLYISNNNGNWPSSKDGLISQGYIKLIPRQKGENYYEIKTILGYVYDWNSDYTLPKYETANSHEYFDRYSIKYGIRVEDLRIEKGKLVEVKTNLPVLLIEGPFKFLLKGEYRKVSRDLYKEMLYHQNIKKSDPNQP